MSEVDWGDQRLGSFPKDVPDGSRGERISEGRGVVRGAGPLACGCFDAATELLTDRGWRRFTALDRSERLATLNPETWAIEYHRPVDYRASDCNEQLMVVESPLVNLAVTGAHSLYVATGRNGGFQRLRATAASGHSLRFLRSGHWRGGAEGRPGKRVEVPGSGMQLSDPDRRLGYGLAPAVGLRARRVPLAPFLAFLGRYLASGVCYTPPGGCGRVVLPESSGTAELAAACGFSVGIVHGQLVIEEGALYDYVAGVGETHSKRMPRSLLLLPSDALLVLREALFQGRRRFVTASPHLAGDVQEVLLKTGASGNVVHVRPGRYAVSIIDDWTPLVRRGPCLATEPYVGKVWSVTVPNAPIYVRRAGVPVWVGDCRGCA